MPHRKIDINSNATAQGGRAASDGGRTFTHLWYVRDRLGSVRTVVDDEGTIRQCTMYYPSGLPVQLFGTERVSDRAHIGNRWSNFAGLGWHDNTARWHDAILDRFTPPPTPKPPNHHHTQHMCSVPEIRLTALTSMERRIGLFHGPTTAIYADTATTMVNTGEGVYHTKDLI